MAHVRLNLGLPGHKALLWLAPIIVARVLGRCRAGATVGAAATAGATFAVGGHLGGGPLGLPLLVVAGVFLDLVTGALESGRIPAWLHVPAICGAATIANLICLTKRLLLPAGFGAHLLLDASGFWFQLASYAFFGLLAGLIATAVTHLFRRQRCRCP